MRLLPVAGHVLVGLGQRRVDVDGAEDPVQANALLHRQHKFGDQVTGMLAGDSDTEDLVLAGHRQHLDQAMRFAVGDGAVEIVDAVGRHFAGNAFFSRLQFVQANAGNFGFDEGGPGDHRVIGLEFPQRVEKRVDRGIPGLMRCGMGELERAGDVTGGVDVRVAGLQEFVGVDGAAGRNPQFLEAEAGQVGGTADGDQHGIEGNADLLALIVGDQDLLAALDDESSGAVIDQDRDALVAETLRDHFRYLGILAHHDARRHLHLRHPGAETGKGLGQFTADRATAEDDQPPRQFAQFPDVVRGQVADFLDARDGWQEGAGAGGDDDAARRQPLRIAIGSGYFDFPRRDDPGRAVHDIDAEPGVALGRVVRLDRPDHRLHPFHDGGEVEVGARRGDAEFVRTRHVRQQPCRADQRLRRHAAGIEAITAQLVLFDQRHPGLDCGSDVRSHQPGAAAADDHDIAVEARRLLPFGVYPVPADHLDDPAGDQRKDAEQDKRSQQRRRQDPGERFELAQLRAGIDVDHRAGQHADLADPIEGPCLHAGQTEQQIDQEEGEDRHQTQGKQVEGAFATDALIDGRQALAKATLHPIAEQEARHQESQRGADGRREGHDQRSPQQSEHRAAGQRQQGGARQRERRRRHINEKVDDAAQQRLRRLKALDGCLLFLEGPEIEVLPKIESKERGNGHACG